MRKNLTEKQKAMVDISYAKNVARIKLEKALKSYIEAIGFLPEIKITLPARFNIGHELSYEVSHNEDEKETSVKVEVVKQ